MKLAAKLVALLVVGVIVLLVVNASVSIQRDVELFETDMQRDVSQLGRTLKDLVEDVWRASGRDRAITLIEDANEEGSQVTVRWVWLDAQPGDPHAARVSSDSLGPLQSDKPVSITQSDENGVGVLHTYIPVTVDDDRAGAIELAKSLDGLDAFRRTTVIRTILLAVALLTGAAVGTVLLGLGMVGRPLHWLIEKTRRVGKGDLSGDLILRGHDEFAELAVALNKMCEQLAEARQGIQTETEARIATLEQLRHADRLHTVGRLASGVAHELGTPLNVVSGRADLIALGGLSSDEIVENAGIIQAQADRMATIIRQLLDFARRRSLRREPIDLRQLAQQTANLLSPMARKRNVTFQIGDGAQKTANVDVAQMQQVMTNLLVNAIQAMPNGGQVLIDVDVQRATPPQEHEAAEGDFLAIVVRDRGTGIGDETRRHVFEPFFTTKDVGEGTGLGLSIAYGIVQEHGGWIDVASRVGEGSSFAVYLPKEADSCPVEC